MSAGETLRAGLAELGLPWRPGQEERLETFRQELERWNQAYGFVKAEGRELVVRHFLDCLAAWALLRDLQPRRSVLDVGTGAGFPGIPLAVVLPDSFFTLLERSAKKAAFLRGALALMGLANASVQQAQLREHRGRYDLVTFRAFSPLDRELGALRERLNPGGCIAAYKGRRSRIDKELASAGLPALQVEIHPLQVPYLAEERHLVLVR